MFAKPRVRLFLVSFLLLFLELLVIRLVGTEIRIFAYLSNFTLLAIFVGSGLGMVLRKKIPVEYTELLLFILTVVTSLSYIVRLPNLEFKLFSGITELLAPLSEDYIWLQTYTFSKTGIIIGIFLTIVLFIFIALMFVPLGKLLGEIFDKDKKPIEAYTVNVLASILGMWAFYGLSAAGISPLFGIVLAQLILLFILDDKLQRYFAIAILAVTVAFLTPKISYQPYEGPVTFWSPYQKLTLSTIKSNKPLTPFGYYLEVNNVGYMGLLNLDNAYKATVAAELADKGIKLPDYFILTDHYSIPYSLKPNPDSVLIIGAGGGNDVAAAIRGGAKSIDAVEIDPFIVRIGELYHPEKPYSDQKVKVTVDDGRAFFTRADKKYDLIVMGLADSHTLSSSLTNLRLDNFLYTVESLNKAKSLLKDDGFLVLAFEVTRPWIGGHLDTTLKDAFGHTPRIFEVRSDGYFGWGGYIFAISKNQADLERAIDSNPPLKELITVNSKSFVPASELTDAWPYLYFPGRKIPLIHLIIAVIILGILLLARTTIFVKSELHWEFFLLGAAFLLFEFQNVTKTSLLFGSTWITNLFTISAILLLITLANLVAGKYKLSTRTAVIGLAVTLAMQFIIPVESFNLMTFWPKVAVSSILLNLPLFFAGLIFAKLFAASRDRSAAFSSNLIGSAFGGFLEMLSFQFGITSLLIVSCLIYFAAAVKILRK